MGVALRRFGNLGHIEGERGRSKDLKPNRYFIHEISSSPFSFLSWTPYSTCLIHRLSKGTDINPSACVVILDSRKFLLPINLSCPLNYSNFNFQSSAHFGSFIKDGDHNKFKITVTFLESSLIIWYIRISDLSWNQLKTMVTTSLRYHKLILQALYWFHPIWLTCVSNLYCPTLIYND